MIAKSPWTVRWSVVIGLSVAALVVYLILRETQSHDDLSPEAYDFAVADTASIDRIVVWNRSPDTAVLTRQAGVWLINGAHPARPDAVEVRRPGNKGRLRWQLVSDVAVTWEQLELF
jgi:hypothetical protein